MCLKHNQGSRQGVQGKFQNGKQYFNFIKESKAMATQRRNLLIRLQKATTAAEKRKLRKRLRRLGHEGGLGTATPKQLKLKKRKKLTAAEVKAVHKHNRAVSRRIEEGTYKPFSKEQGND